MEVKIYVDVLFIINFIIDYILLSVTSFFVKKTPSVFKMCLSSTTGALFSATAFFVQMSSFFSFFYSVLIAFFMVFLAFGAKKATLLIKDTAIFYLICICTAGIGFSVVFSGKLSQTAINNGIFYADVNAYTLLLVFVISVLVIHTSTGYIKKQKIKSYRIYLERL